MKLQSLQFYYNSKKNKSAPRQICNHFDRDGKFTDRPGIRLLQSFLMILGPADFSHEKIANSRYHSLREAESDGYW